MEASRTEAGGRGREGEGRGGRGRGRSQHLYACNVALMMDCIHTMYSHDCHMILTRHLNNCVYLT